MSLTKDVIDNVAAEIDLLGDIYVQSDNVPATLREFIDELAIGDVQSDLPPDARSKLVVRLFFCKGLRAAWA